MRALRALGRVIADRLGLEPLAKHVLEHPIPEENTGRKGWMYVLGAATLTAFIVQLVTGAALATINRLPVLLLPGDIFAARRPAPVLQQLESPSTQDISVNDCFRPVSKYWDRINRPDQLITALPEALRILTSPAETGAVTLCLPQDVQAEAFDYPEALFRRRVWTIARPRPDEALLRQAASWLRSSKAPIIIAGGGAIYSEATDALGDRGADTVNVIIQ